MYYSLYQLKCILLRLSLCFCILFKLFQTDVDECQSGLFFAMHKPSVWILKDRTNVDAYLVMQERAFLPVQVGGEQNES